MSDSIKITDLMAVALKMAVPMGDELCVPLQFQGSMGTMKGLVTRGLIEDRLIANGDLPGGYEGKYPNVRNWHHVLTPRGEVMRELLTACPERHSFPVSALDAEAEVAAEQHESAEAGPTCEYTFVKLTGSNGRCGAAPREGKRTCAHHAGDVRYIEPKMDADDFQHLVGTERTDHRGLLYRVREVRHYPASRNQGPCVEVSGRVIVETPDGSNPNTPERPTYENSTWYDAHASEIFRPGDAVPEKTEPVVSVGEVLNLSDAMVNGIIASVRTDDGGVYRLSLTTRSGTTLALMNRGIAKYDRERSSSHGHTVHILTPRGAFLRGYLSQRPGDRVIPVPAVVEASATSTVPEVSFTVSLMVKQVGATDGFTVVSCDVPASKADQTQREILKWSAHNPIPADIKRDSRWIYYVPQPKPTSGERVVPMISTQSAMPGKIHRSDGSVSPVPPAIVWEDRSNRANVREVSKVLKVAGFVPRNGEQIMARSGYHAFQDGARVRVTWRDGADTDALGEAERIDTKRAMNDAYAAVLGAAGYPLSERETGSWVYVMGAKRKS